MAMSFDDAVTVITNAARVSESDARAAMAGMSTRLLRGVADLTYAVGYPDSASRKELVAGILAELGYGKDAK
jgi:hypothetical protein